jgi:predicted phage-related endonuclease
MKVKVWKTGEVGISRIEQIIQANHLLWLSKSKIRKEPIKDKKRTTAESYLHLHINLLAETNVSLKTSGKAS